MSKSIAPIAFQWSYFGINFRNVSSRFQTACAVGVKIVAIRIDFAIAVAARGAVGYQ